MSKIKLERARTAEEVGVSSKEVQAFVDHCIELKKEIHSVMVIRHGKVACEAYRSPYNAKDKHMMYSVSKSFCATAIGFAIDEGYMQLDTKFIDIFPETRRTPTDENLEKLTVEDLLTMRSGLSVTPFMDKTKESWFEAVIGSDWVDEPGSRFLYISENMYLLCHMIHRLCGCSVMDYLQPRLFEPLGIENAFWETDKCGVEAGGWGMMLSTEDMGKFILTYLNKGKFNGKQVIPEWFAVEATSFHADTTPTKSDLDTIHGYGYCFWRCGGHENAFRADGMFSQFAIAFEDLDACLVFTGGEINEQNMRDVIWPHFPKAFDDNIREPGIKVEIPAYEKLPEAPRSPLETELNNKTIRFSKSVLLNAIGFPVSVLTLPAVYMEAEKAGNIDNVSFLFSEKEVTMTWNEGDEVNSIRIGMDGEYRRDEIVLGGIKYHTESTATWRNDNELELQIRPIETTCERRLIFKFKGKKVTMAPSSIPTVLTMAETLKESIEGFFKIPALGKAAGKSLPLITGLVDEKASGKIC